MLYANLKESSWSPEGGKDPFTRRCVLWRLRRGFAEGKKGQRRLAWLPTGPCCFLWDTGSQNTHLRQGPFGTMRQRFDLQQVHFAVVSQPRRNKAPGHLRSMKHISSLRPLFQLRCIPTTALSLQLNHVISLPFRWVRFTEIPDHRILLTFWQHPVYLRPCYLRLSSQSPKEAQIC